MSKEMPAQVPGVRFTTEPQRVARVETRHRRIATDLPVPESLPLLAKLHAGEPRSMWGDGPPLVWDRAEGHQVYDPYGNKWLDFAAGTFVANAGHGNPEVLSAMMRQIAKPLVNAYVYPTEVRARLVERLTTLRPGLDCALILTTGSETTECALKLSRIRGRKRDPRKIAMIAFEGGFHGKTLGAQTMTGIPHMREWIANPDPDVHHIPYPFPGHPASFERSIQKLVETKGLDPDLVAGIIFEPYQGWSSNLCPPQYVREMRKWADAHDALLIADEIQSGFGRSGRLFGCDHFDMMPDIMCLSKAVANGVPLSVVLSRREILDVDPVFNTTHAGNPLMCAAALASVEYILRERLWERAAELGEVLGPRLRKIQQRFVRWAPHLLGIGLSWCFITHDPDSGARSAALPPRVNEKAFQKGLLLMSTPGAFIKVAPPLTIDREALSEGVDVLEECFEEATRQ